MDFFGHALWVCLAGLLPRDRGILPVMEYLRDNIANESCVKQALEYLAILMKEEGASLDKTSKLVIVKAMRDYISEVDIEVSGCSILNNLIITGRVGGGGGREGEERQGGRGKGGGGKAGRGRKGRVGEERQGGGGKAGQG